MMISSTKKQTLKTTIAVLSGLLEKKEER